MMWAATLITSGAAALGRVFLVQFLPSLLLVSTGSLFVRGHAFNFDGSPTQLSDLVSLGSAVDTPGLLLLVGAAVILAGVTQSFQIGIVRAAEGYWGFSNFGLSLSQTASSFERRRLQRFDRRYSETPSVATIEKSKVKANKRMLPLEVQKRNLGLARERARGLAAENVVASYPLQDEWILPTRLGNTLRSTEQRAGERYGYDSLATWPRLYPHLNDKLASAYQASVDAIDAGVNFFFAFLLMSLMCLVAFADTPQRLWLTLACLAFAWISYRGAVAAAAMQGVMTNVAFDQHRFDLFRSLHLALPKSAYEEMRAASELTSWLAQPPQPGSFVKNFPDALYDHKGNSGSTQ